MTGCNCTGWNGICDTCRPTLDWNKPIQTRGGRKEVNGHSHCVLVDIDGEELYSAVTDDGMRESWNPPYIVNVPEYIEGWVNVYPDGSLVTHRTKEQADRLQGTQEERLDCVHIKVEKGSGI